MNRTSEDWVRSYNQANALWIHDHNPRRPHALLTSGKHSSGFFNSELVMEDPTFLDEAADDLVHLLIDEGIEIDDVERVVGPAMGAITLAHDMARHIVQNRFTQKPCLRAYTEKETKIVVMRLGQRCTIDQSDQCRDDIVMGQPNKAMVFKKTNIRFGDHCLPVEDVLTTGGSVELTVKAIEKEGGIVLPFVAVLVNRSGLKMVGDKKIVALIDQEMPMWDPKDCPLCRQGSEAIRPKENENWARLNSAY